MSEKRFAHWMMELITAAYEQAERSAPTMTCLPFYERCFILMGSIERFSATVNLCSSYLGVTMSLFQILSLK